MYYFWYKINLSTSQKNFLGWKITACTNVANGHHHHGNDFLWFHIIFMKNLENFLKELKRNILYLLIWGNGIISHWSAIINNEYTLLCLVAHVCAQNNHSDGHNYHVCGSMKTLRDVDSWQTLGLSSSTFWIMLAFPFLAFLCSCMVHNKSDLWDEGVQYL